MTACGYHDAVCINIHLQAQNREVGWLSYNRRVSFHRSQSNQNPAEPNYSIIQTGQIEREQQPLLKKLKLLLLFNPLTEWIDTTHAMRLHTHDESVDAGRREAKPSSKRQIKGFVDAYHINMNDFEPSDIDAYDSFESFFIRHHTPESRPIYEETDPTKAVVVADSRVVTYESVPKLRKLWVKGRNFSMAELTMDMELGDHFADSAVASFRLSPQDYHRYHSPVSGKIKLFRSIPGDYYQVDPVALRSDVDILTRNHREFVVINSEEFGDVLFVAIGATDVGTVQ